jgi:hypothetical protein
MSEQMICAKQGGVDFAPATAATCAAVVIWVAKSRIRRIASLHVGSAGRRSGASLTSLHLARGVRFEQSWEFVRRVAIEATVGAVVPMSRSEGRRLDAGSDMTRPHPHQ